MLKAHSSGTVEEIQHLPKTQVQMVRIGVLGINLTKVAGVDVVQHCTRRWPNLN